MPEGSGATSPQGESLVDASTAIQGLLSIAEDQKPKGKQPEQTPSREQGSEQVEDAPPEDAEQAAGDEPPTSEEQNTEQEDTEPPQLFPVKINGKTVQVPLEELQAGYSRTEDYTQKTQTLAERRRMFEEQEVVAVREERQKYATQLTELHTALKQLMPTEPNWSEHRARVSPEQFAADLLAWNEHKTRLAGVEAEQQRVSKSQQDDAARGFRQYVTEQETKLKQVLPDFADPVKAPVIARELREFGKTLGFTDADLQGVTDHRLVKVLHDAMQYSKAQAAKPTVKNKIDKALETKPPGNRAPTTPKSKRLVTQQKLAQTGSVDDGARAIEALLD